MYGKIAAEREDIQSDWCVRQEEQPRRMNGITQDRGDDTARRKACRRAR